MLRFLTGLFLGMSLSVAAANTDAIVAFCNTNGVLEGYVVQDANGREVCKNPSVWLEFRGDESYIVCDQ
jgi:hypothetical protein